MPRLARTPSLAWSTAAPTTTAKCVACLHSICCVFAFRMLCVSIPYAVCYHSICCTVQYKRCLWPHLPIRPFLPRRLLDLKRQMCLCSACLLKIMQGHRGSDFAFGGGFLGGLGHSRSNITSSSDDKNDGEGFHSGGTGSAPSNNQSEQPPGSRPEPPAGAHHSSFWQGIGSITQRQTCHQPLSSCPYFRYGIGGCVCTCVCVCVCVCV